MPLPSNRKQPSARITLSRQTGEYKKGVSHSLARDINLTNIIYPHFRIPRYLKGYGYLSLVDAPDSSFILQVTHTPSLTIEEPLAPFLERTANLTRHRIIHHLGPITLTALPYRLPNRHEKVGLLRIYVPHPTFESLLSQEVRVPAHIAASILVPRRVPYSVYDSPTCTRYLMTIWTPHHHRSTPTHVLPEEEEGSLASFEDDPPREETPSASLPDHPHLNSTIDDHEPDGTCGLTP